MITNILRYLLRGITSIMVVAVGALVTAPAILDKTAAFTLAAAKKKEPVVSRAEKRETVVSATAAEHQALPPHTDSEDLYLAKRVHEPGHLKPKTESIPVITGAHSTTAGTAPSKAPVAAAVEVKPTVVAKPKPAAGKPAPVKTVVKSVTDAAKVAVVLAYARAQLGERYLFGGAGPSAWDCSGLTMKAFEAAGINIGGHGVNVQYNLAKSKGYLVPWSQRKAGDLVFYGTPGAFSHVAIYTGGDKIIEAANPQRPVIERPYWGTPYGQVARFIR